MRGEIVAAIQRALRIPIADAKNVLSTGERESLKMVQ
jgi:hypothetical protein